MNKNKSPVLDDMRVVFERGRAMRSNNSSAWRVIYAERGNRVRLHIDEARVHECQADVHGRLSPARRVMTHVRGSHASLQGCNAGV